MLNKNNNIKNVNNDDNKNYVVSNDKKRLQKYKHRTKTKRLPFTM
jgi:hypothetical protein